MESNEFKIRVLPLGQKLHRFAMSLLKDMHESEDIVQEIFLRLWNMRFKLSEIENIDAFAFRMTRNLCLDRIKAKKPKLLDTDNEPGLQETEAKVPDPENQLIMSDAMQEVHRQIGQLPEQQRMVIMLRDVEGYTYEEVAEAMDMEVNTVRVNLSRARKTIRESMSKIYQPWKI
jgi:RNA polymerase sigma-70 factor (family 1)